MPGSLVDPSGTAAHPARTAVAGTDSADRINEPTVVYAAGAKLRVDLALLCGTGQAIDAPDASKPPARMRTTGQKRADAIEPLSRARRARQ